MRLSLTSEPATVDALDRLAAVSTLHDLQTPSPTIYWSDLLASAAAGWGAFAVACTVGNGRIAAIAAALAIVLLYRAYLFIHELSHAARHIPGFVGAWNVVAGFPLLVPSCMAVGVHAAHHRPSTYGTAEDPEYLPFGRSRAHILRFLAVCFAFPWLMALRFLVAGPVGLFVPPLRRALERHATSLAMNASYVRTVSAGERRTIFRQQVGLLALWVPLLLLLGMGIWPLRVALVWATVATGVALINGVRTLAAHHYESDGSVRNREEQWADSIDIPGSWWTTIWAPVGHRYHALHHYVPGLPYHNLAAAYRRLSASAAPGGGATPGDVSPGLKASLLRLWSSAGRARAGAR